MNIKNPSPSTLPPIVPVHGTHAGLEPPRAAFNCIFRLPDWFHFHHPHHPPVYAEIELARSSGNRILQVKNHYELSSQTSQALPFQCSAVLVFGRSTCVLTTAPLFRQSHFDKKTFPGIISSLYVREDAKPRRISCGSRLQATGSFSTQPGSAAYTTSNRMLF